MAATQRSMVVIGASLGGLEALRTLLGALPADYPLPIAVVQHQDASAGDALAVTLGGSIALLVREAEDKLPIEPGTVVLAPSDYHLLVEGSHFALDAGAPVNHARPSIDVLFESAAEAHDVRVIGVLLTGNSVDGAEGLAAIGRRGGAVLVQDPADAVAPAMPLAGLKRVPRAEVLGLDALAARLRNLAGEVR